MKLTMNVIFTKRELAPLRNLQNVSFITQTTKEPKHFQSVFRGKERKLLLMNQWIHQYQSQQAPEKKERKDKVQLIQMLM